MLSKALANEKILLRKYYVKCFNGNVALFASTSNIRLRKQNVSKKVQKHFLFLANKKCFRNVYIQGNNVYLPLQHSLKAFSQGKLKFLEANRGNRVIEHATSSSALALMPSAQQSQHSRKSSPPTKGLNESQDRPWLNKRKVMACYSAARRTVTCPAPSQ